MRLRRPIKTRFRYGYPSRVNLATYRNSQAHSSKGTRSLHISPEADTLPRLVGTRFQVLFHDPSPGCFSPFPHGTGSLSVTREYLGLGGGPPRFTRNFSGSVLLGIPPGSRTGFALRGYHPLCQRFPTLSATHTISYSLPERQLWPGGPATPPTQRLPALTRDWFSLFRFRSPLLTESRLLSLPAGTEMFHFPALPPPALCVQAGVTGNYARQVSPFGNPRIKVWLPTPRGLSQAPTSFIGSWCQGIHRVPLITWLLQLMLASTMQFSKYDRSPPLNRRVPQHTRSKAHDRGRSARSRSSPEGEDQQASLPSGPNSVPSQPTPAAGVPPAQMRVY